MIQFTINQKKLNRIILLIFLSFIIQSCEEILQIEIPDKGPMINVNCILNEGEPIQMRITQSQTYPAASDSAVVIKNAVVKLFEDDVYIEDLVYQETYKFVTGFRARYLTKNYISLNQFSPRLNHSYTIKVSAPDLSEVTSSTVLPHPVPLISVDTTNTMYTLNGNYQYKTIQCKIKFRDPPGIRNCYKFSITRFGSLYERSGISGYSETSTIKYIVPFICRDLNAVYFKRPPESQVFGIPVPEEEEAIPDKIYFADDSFDGMTYELVVLIPVGHLFDIAYPPQGVKFTMRKINFELSSINEEYYKYARSNYIQVYKKNDFFSEPCYVYRNISNGVGIFSGTSVSVDSSILMPVTYNMPYYRK